MDPITAICIVGFLAPPVPTRIRALELDRTAIALAPNLVPSTKVFTATDCLTAPTEVRFTVARATRTPLQTAVESVRSFEAPGSVDAEQFLNGLPSGFPIPHTVHSEDGVVALFWETGTFYADIEFPGGGVFSVFTRQRGVQPLDRGLDDVAMTRPFSYWGYDYLGSLAPALQRAA